MMKLDPSMRRLLMWTLPIALLAIVLGVELNWGRAMRRVPPPETSRAPAPVSVGLLPEYAIAGGAAALGATSAHTLFNPTRRPAPPALATASGPSQLLRGQFILTGTAVYGDKAVAYLKETNGGKPRTVRKGETINGMLVAEVNDKGIRFSLGNETEDLPLKVAVGPRSTVQPPVAMPLPVGGGAPGNPMLPGAQQVNLAQPISLAERRRAARAAEAERQRGETGMKNSATPADNAAQGNASGAAASTAPANVNNGQDARWQQLYQRYRNRAAAPQ